MEPADFEPSFKPMLLVSETFGRVEFVSPSERLIILMPASSETYPALGEFQSGILLLLLKRTIRATLKP